MGSYVLKGFKKGLSYGSAVMITLYNFFIVGKTIVENTGLNIVYFVLIILLTIAYIASIFYILLSPFELDQKLNDIG